ncbi:MAG: GxxExxY protein [Deltaproteobacteria bacterium]|nr:GxxExxY protein [Deltaproteobacteria bacterium]
MLSWKDVFEEQAQILFNRVNEAQLLTYLKMTKLNLGFLLNWNVTLMKDGIKRMVNNLRE